MGAGLGVDRLVESPNYSFICAKNIIPEHSFCVKGVRSIWDMPVEKAVRRANSHCIIDSPSAGDILWHNWMAVNQVVQPYIWVIAAILGDAYGI